VKFFKQCSLHRRHDEQDEEEVKRELTVISLLGFEHFSGIMKFFTSCHDKVNFEV
jgi:hypothetical protein